MQLSLCFITELDRACASTVLVAVSHITAEKAVEAAATDLVKDKWLSRMPTWSSLGSVRRA